MELTDAIRKRRTIRRYSQRSVERDKLTALIDAARLAPTGGNMQQLRYVVVRTAETVNKVFEQTAWAAMVKPKRNPEIGKTAPTAFIAVTSKNAGAGQNANAGAAIQNILLKAVELELGCCWIGSFDKKQTHQILGLADDTEILFLVAVGYPDESPVSEVIGADEPCRYYLDDNDVLHVPKYRVDVLTEWV